MKKIEKLNTVCNVLSTFVGEHKAVVDEKTRADFKAVETRVASEMFAGAKARDQIAVARTSRDVAFEDLQDKILETKKCVEMVVIRDKKGVAIPELGDLINNPARIHILAGRFLTAASQAGNDPVLVKTAGKLQASLDAYIASYNETYDRVSARTEAIKTNDDKLVSLGGEVNAYRMLIAYRSPENLRRELVNRLKAALPRQGRKGGEKNRSEATVVATAQPTAIPALPMIPGVTTVPQTGDHPQLSANA
ncbi:MAG: hypothetical protein HY897_05675 [Deltaproteobacteria bacterium]|nr:hypothetical protein [Deltaproteobacteria bacterium]